MQLVQSEGTMKKPFVWLEIEKEKLLKNVIQIKRFVQPSTMMAIVKANAYGVGSLGVAMTIEKEVDAFGVVGCKEALTLRVGGITKPIINLGMYSSDDADSLIRKNIQPTIFTYSAFQDFERAVKKRKTMQNVWIKVDTGLNRLGVPFQEALRFIRSVAQSKTLRIEGVFSALTEDKQFDAIQLQRFLTIKEECQRLKIAISRWSIASSDAALLFPEARLDMVRIGISLLGFYPSKDAKALRPVDLAPAVTFKTKIACVKELEAVESVFYRRTFIAKRKTRIAVLLPGYSYGLDSKLVRGGKVLIRGGKYPFVGGIGATNCFVDIGNNKNIRAGDEVVLFGKQKNEEIQLEELCALLKQNEYEFLSRIPEKVDRLFV